MGMKAKNIKFGQQLFNIDLMNKSGKVIIHPDFTGEENVDPAEVKFNDDIAIIVLPKEVDFPENSDTDEFVPDRQSGTFVRPICMPDLNDTRRYDAKPLSPFNENKQKTMTRNDYVWITGYETTNK